MKIALLGDTHWGVRNDMPVFYRHMEKFYNWFFDQLKENKIDQLIQLGDLFDRRKYINLKTLHQAEKIMFQPLKAMEIPTHIIVGNHDSYYKDCLDVNSLTLIINQYQNITIYSKPTTVSIDGISCDFFPWICSDNEKSSLQLIENTNSKYAFGHFELAGYFQIPGVISEHGMKTQVLKNYKQVISGHYHTRSQKDNVLYTGTPYEMTWNDYNDPKGYHILDTSTGNIKFVKSPFVSFVKIEYDDFNAKMSKEKYQVDDCFVKVIVKNRTNNIMFDQFINDLQNQAFDVKIIEDFTEYLDGDISQIDKINVENTLDVVSKYIDSLETDMNKDKIKSFVKSLYIEASNLET